MVTVLRLEVGHTAEAKSLFALLASVFGEELPVLSDNYIARLLRREDFWAFAAVDNDEIVGGITAHVLPMTNSEASELFIYDLAVRSDCQRKGIGNALVRTLCNDAIAMGIDTVFVPADNDDTGAIAFYHAIGGAAAGVTFFTFER